MTAADRTDDQQRPHILMIGNNATPTDRRMWLECTALREAGLAVSVVSPETREAPAREQIDGVDIYRYRPPARSGRRRGFVISYAASWLHTLRLSMVVWRHRRFDIIQACNPPDTYFSIALLFKLFGVRFIFDQHDLSPEIYQDRFTDPSPKVHSLLLRLERMTHRAADHVITVNESCKNLLLSRTPTPSDRLTVIRTGPDLARLRLSTPQPGLKAGKRYLCAYLGVMGPQDGVDLLLHTIDVLVHELGRNDIQFVFMGDGQCFVELTALARELDVEPWVQFTGWADDSTISSVLSTSDLGLQPDRRTPFTDMCTMLKTVEYMAFGLPVVSFDLAETHRTAGDAAVYVTEETPRSYAQALVALLDDPDRRAAMGAGALRRARTDLAWGNQKSGYVAVVRAVLGTRRGGSPRVAGTNEDSTDQDSTDQDGTDQDSTDQGSTQVPQRRDDMVIPRQNGTARRWLVRDGQGGRS